MAPAFTALDTPLKAASSEGCEGGGFSIVLPGGAILEGELDTTVPAASLGTSFLVKGKYIEFEVVSATFGINNYLFTGAANPRDITGGVRTIAYARKTPDHRGLTLTSRLTVEAAEGDIELNRTGAGLSMKIQAKDCANGGLFQMEVERGDGTATDITHVLNTAAPGTATQMTAFYFDNPNFRAREGDTVPYKDTTVVVTARVNFGNDFSRKFVGRDSPQVAARQLQGCPNQIQKRDGTFVNVDHCGGVSVWRVVERRADGRRLRRGRDRSRATGHDLHPPVPGAEPRQGAVGEARLPVPGAGHEPAEAAVPRGLRTLNTML